jgi:hypothetical protein
MNYIEEKTPGGITIKVILNSWEYTAFNKSGNVIYADISGGKVLHKVPVVAFFGQYFKPVINIDSELAFYKIRKGEIVIPYEDLVLKKRKYLFLKYSENLELIPVRLIPVSNIYKLVREIENGVVFNYIVIDKSVSKNEIIVIKNRSPYADIIQTGLGEINRDKEPGTYDTVLFDEDPQVEDIPEDDIEKNLNIMSNNPVFLAKIHLKKLALSKVNQILLDFDISSLEAEYMLRFIETMLQNKESDNEVIKAKPKLEAQADAFRFYINLVNKNDIEIKKLIMEINDQSKLSSYSTLLAKVKLLFSKQEDIFMLTEYENLLFEKKAAF